MRSTVDDEIGTTMQIIGESLCEAVDVMPDERVLDVASGNGNATLAAARRGAEVTVSDDAEALALPDATFDVVLSTFGVMFAPQPEVAAAELLRVTRPAGRIGLANWTPGGFVGQMFRIVGGYLPPPAGLPSPLEWGDRSRLHELLGHGVSSLDVRSTTFVFRYRSPRHWVDAFRTQYGPVLKAFAALDDAGRDALDADLLALARAHDATAGAGTLRIPSEYLEVVAVRSA
jgi:SAM-dependent methyltransferase